MAKKTYDGPLNRHMDFAAAGPQGEPASGLAVQTYMKGLDAGKFGVGYTLADGSAHLIFADEEDMLAYQLDNTRVDLIKDVIELNNQLYNLTINMITGAFVPVFLGSKGNYVQFTFNTVNRGNQPISEPVTAMYTITRGQSRKVVTETYRAGTTASFNLDDYLLEGENTVIIEVRGQITRAVMTTTVVYQVINLSLVDSMNIAQVHTQTGAVAAVLSIPYTVQGIGHKVMEWYLDGEQLQYVQSEDEITESSATRTKYINLAGLAQGVHHVQFRVSMQVSGQDFYSEVHYREFIVSTGDESGDPIVVTAAEFPMGAENVLGPNDDLVLPMRQYEPYSLRLACFNPDHTYRNVVDVEIDSVNVASIRCTEGEEAVVPLTVTTDGEVTVDLIVAAKDFTRSIDAAVDASSIDIHDITSDLELAFSAEGRNNASANRSAWTDGVHTATFEGFKWTETSGWVNGKLLIPSGASVAFNYAPLAVEPTTLGKTLEFDFRSIDVDDDDAVLIDLMSDGVGLRITATQVIVRSRAGVEMARRYKSDEDIRVVVVMNRKTGSTNHGLAFVYFNGIVSVAVNLASTDGYLSNKLLTIGGTGAGILLKQIRIYNTALSSESVLNNHILYRDTTAEMMALYDRNNLYQPGTQNFDIDKIASVVPVMIITGNIPVIEGSTDKNVQITADVRYIDMQEPSRSFTVRNAVMRGQGTSSMTYPKKNLRLYTRKSDQTVLLDANGNVVSSRKWSFKEGAQPVDCWCLKTDFAESSGTHNTGVARLMNKVMVDAQVEVNGSMEYALRTEAQKSAVLEGYEYDVRTTVDGFPIVVFYHLTEQDDLIFLGKYNFNNDKSTESVFGFTGIPGFDDTHVQCFEFLDSGNPLALFTTIEGFDADWDKAWESRYPDTKTPNLVPLKSLATWLVSTAGADPAGDASAQAKFAEWQAHKADHFDLTKLAAYYVYLMRFGAVDQTVKNSMIMTEDGVHWFFILYDNDTILGVRNDGLLRYGPEIDRQTTDPEIGGYAYAGHSATIWNNFEADPECMALAKKVDAALYSAGLTYENVIDMFNVKQAGKWSESIYNQDAQYKYIGPWVNEGLNYLGSLQGSRSDHRKWWLSSRFALLDALWTNGAYTGRVITLLIPGAQQGTTFGMRSGKDFYYGFGENNIILVSGEYIESGNDHTFTLTKNMEIGSPLRIYAPYYIQALDLSNFITYIGATNFNLSAAYDEALGCKMKSLVLGVSNPVTDLRRNTALAGLSGIDRIVTLEHLNIAGYEALLSLDLSTLVHLQSFDAKASGLTSVSFAPGAPLTSIEYPAALQALTLRGHTELRRSGITLEGDGVNIHTIDIRGCSLLTSSPDLLLDWLDNKTTEDQYCEVYMDNVNWPNISEADIRKIAAFKANGGSLTLRGFASMASIGTLELAETLMAAFGADIFNPASGFYIDAPAAIYLSGPTQVLEGENAQYRAIVIGGQPGGTTTFQISSGSRTGTSINQDTGLLTTTENGQSDSNLTIRCNHVSGSQVSQATLNIVVKKAVYPSASQVVINGPSLIEVGIQNTYEVGYTLETITGRMTAVWSLTGDLANVASIVSQSNERCVVALNGTPSSDVVSGKVQVVLTKTATGSSVATKDMDVAYVDDTIAISRITKPELMQTVYGSGWCASPDKMTKVEAALVTEVQLGITWYNARYNDKEFDEFKYFTGIQNVPSQLFSNSNFTKITLPNSVTSIGNNAFQGCTGLTSITIPDSVTTIGGTVFYNCTGLRSITFGSGLTSIGSSAFSGCTGLTSITVDSGNQTFYDGGGNCIIKRSNNELVLGCKNTTIPNTVTSIGNDAFQSCTGLTSITIPDSVTTIGNSAFYGCTGLTSITIPNSVTEIVQYAFYSCSSLTSITIPDSVTTIGQYAFQYCTGLTSVTIGSGLTVISKSVFNGCTGLTSITIPSGVTTIGQSAFQGCTGMTSITIPDAVTSIGNSAFYGCTGLTSITIPSGVTTIGQSAFYGCTGLTSITIPSGVTSIGNQAFSGCTGLTSITIPDSVTTIGGSAFYGCSSLTSITLGSGVTSIGDNAFYGCTSLTSITVDSQNQIYYDGGGNCIVISNGNELILGCKNTTIPNTVTSIGSSAFSGCSSLTSITIPSGVTSIGSYAFDGCSGLTSITIPNTVTFIGNYAFSGCSSLTSITIPSGVTSIGSYAFNRCTGLTSITCEATNPPTIVGNTLPGTSVVQHIYVPSASVSAYQAASNWSSYASVIGAISA